METAISGGFSIEEAQFHLGKSPRTLKIYTAIASLPEDAVAKIPPSILDSQNYSELKWTLMKAHERTKPEFWGKL